MPTLISKRFLHTAPTLNNGGTTFPQLIDDPIYTYIIRKAINRFPKLQINLPKPPFSFPKNHVFFSHKPFDLPANAKPHPTPTLIRAGQLTPQNDTKFTSRSHPARHHCRLHLSHFQCKICSAPNAQPPHATPAPPFPLMPKFPPHLLPPYPSCTPTTPTQIA